MLTRLRGSGFKNLVDLDVRLGPFTCIAGTNGVGKSNFLDAIVFLSRLADDTLLNACLSVRDVGDKSGDVRGLFYHSGDYYADEMTFIAEMIIPGSAVDDLGQTADAGSTFVEYAVGLKFRKDESGRSFGGIELTKESLKHIPAGDAEKHLLFPNSAAWRRRAVRNQRRAPFYISTAGEHILLHQDGGASGKPQQLLARQLPRTLLSRANAAESRTATVVRREMQSWRLLQLEPSALRQPDGFLAPTQLAGDGAHLPATLFHLAYEDGADADAVFAEVANGLSRLIEDVRSVTVDRDERRQLLTLYVRGRDGTAHPARSLSDGTLRFLALEVLSLDPRSQGLLCLEEPENGIHPERLPAMIRLLMELASDTNSEVDEPLRQVIINTHSPAVVAQVEDSSLLLANQQIRTENGRSFPVMRLAGLHGTWRDKAGEKSQIISRGNLLAFLNPVARRDENSGGSRMRRVIDRDEFGQGQLDFSGGDD